MDLKDAEDAWTQATTDFEDWLDEYKAVWNLPMTRTVVGALWHKGVTPQVKGVLRQRMPGQVAEMDQMFSGKR